MTPEDAGFLEEAYRLARKSFEEGGLPIGAILVRNGEIIGRGHNQRIQRGIRLPMVKWIACEMRVAK